MTTHSPELIDFLIRARCRPNHLAADLARELQKIDGLICDIRQAENRRREAKARYEDAELAYLRDIANLQARCPHPSVSRATAECQPTCDLCHKENP